MCSFGRDLSDKKKILDNLAALCAFVTFLPIDLYYQRRLGGGEGGGKYQAVIGRPTGSILKQQDALVFTALQSGVRYMYVCLCM
jgi:hypothetical protein